MCFCSLLQKLRLYTYTAQRRDVLGCTSPKTKRFPRIKLHPEGHFEGQEKSQGQRGGTIAHCKTPIHPDLIESVHNHQYYIPMDGYIYQQTHPMMMECRIPTLSNWISVSLPLLNLTKENNYDAFGHDQDHLGMPLATSLAAFLHNIDNI